MKNLIYNKTKKIVLIILAFAALILQLLFVFHEELEINISQNYLFYISILIMSILLCITIFLFFIKTKKEVIEVVKEKIIYKNNEKDNNDDNIEIDETNNNEIINKLLEDTNSDYEKIISNICKEFNYVQALAYKLDENNKFTSVAKYAYFSDTEPLSFVEGQGLLGQSVKNKKQFILEDIPDDYIIILSGLGNGKPEQILMQPIIINDKVIGVLEFATFNKFSQFEKETIEEISKKIDN